MNNISIVATKCTGCTACVNTCSKQAIIMQKDKEGFYYPVIVDEKCIDCGVCNAVCPVMTQKENQETRIRAYYGAMLDDKIVKESSSGGAFTLLFDYVISHGGTVYGAAIDYETKEVVYKGSDKASIEELRKSKYVASAPKQIFNDVKEKLKNNNLVLFCGLPCHIDGLKKFLIKDYHNLITCDFICGGVASPEFFKQHLTFLEKKYKAKTINVNFRAKLKGWKEHSIKIKFENGKEYKKLAKDDSFFQGYFEKAYQRDSCYKCQYRLSHQADIIIADYWDGLKKDRGNDKGVSMVIANSTKGDEFFSKAIQNQLNNFVEMPISDSDYVFKSELERYNKAIKTKPKFYELYIKYGFEKAAKKTYMKGNWKRNLKIKIIKLIRKK